MAVDYSLPLGSAREVPKVNRIRNSFWNNPHCLGITKFNIEKVKLRFYPVSVQEACSYWCIAYNVLMTCIKVGVLFVDIMA